MRWWMSWSAADPYMLEEELGDVLLQAVLHAQIGDEFRNLPWTA